ncbi:extracellular solute-binding protein [uncultured Sneathiella sp.]|uniref:extracellular solute-binding protein n=1 Tax=uncultured Sneathiella sp. TaxID=879315 RepID=UPI0030EF6757|tara:strand:+ start:27160 stop:29010 length:1851 start_codon:yes stop_codon:yes gene_type:complete
MGFVRSAVAAILFITLPLLASAEEVKTIKSHGLSLAGPLKYGPDFTHLDYVNPDAPKGGDVKLSAVGGFDNLNPYISKGQAANGLGLTFETLLTQSYDDPSAEYGLVAESVEVAEDLSFAIFNMRPEARFHDGAPITADDVIFSLAAVKESGTPLFRYYYANVESAEKLNDHRIKFNFSGPPNRELPQIVGQLLPILSKKYFETHKFEETTLTPILGSGPYRIKSFEANRYITYERVPDYWGKDLPINVGRNNFGTLRYDFYRDTAVLLEAFKAGEYDYRSENSAKSWATGYNFPAVNQGLVILEEVPNERSAGMQGYVFNLRREKFQDPALREALIYAFDFEWLNRNIFYDQYSRTNSYFENSVMAATGEPTEEELAILEPYRDQLPPRVFGPAFKAPVTDGSGQDRAPLRQAKKILNDAGWKVENGKLIDPNTGKPLTIEFLMYDPNSLRITGPYIKNLKKLGIDASSRVVDSAQFTERLRNYDFDMTTAGFGQSISPGNEQREFWGSAAGQRPGSRNVMGIDDPVIDALIENLIAAPTYEKLIPAVRALDRVLTWNFFVVPQFHASYDRIAYWNKFGHMDVNPAQGPDILSWWVDPDKERRLQEGLKKIQQPQ